LTQSREKEQGKGSREKGHHSSREKGTEQGKGDRAGKRAGKRGREKGTSLDLDAD
jgi:hypothetical protein